jgi:hypothetical protein
MKNKITVALAITGLALALPLSAVIAENEKTVIGEGACAKCLLKETEACQSTIKAEEGDKKVTYYLTQNEITKEFGKNLCAEKKKVKATGTVKTVNGKQELTPTKIELVKS